MSGKKIKTGYNYQFQYCQKPNVPNAEAKQTPILSHGYSPWISTHSHRLQGLVVTQTGKLRFYYGLNNIEK